MRFWIIVAAFLSLAAPCAAQKLSPPPPVAIAPLPAGASPQPISLVRLAANLPAGKTWAEVADNPLCAKEYTLQWDSKDNDLQGNTELQRAFRDAFAQAGLRIAGDPTNLFEETKSSDLQLGALITDVRARFCSFATGEAYKGVLVMDVEWQVFSVVRAQVVARIHTQGGFELKKYDKAAVANLIRGAFGDNALRLASNEEFRAIVLKGPSGPAQVAPSPISFRAAPAGGRTSLAIATKSVVSVFSGDGMGSGVLISPDGYILTNFHVAGPSGQVRIRWSDGVETVGEVLRADRGRDVALIRTSPHAAPLAIRGGVPQLGETVFAIGTPMDKKLAGTLTRGIVSANRTLDGQTWIQSDVAVTHGNSGGPLLDERGAILGLTAWGVAPNDSPIGLNFFIPIQDALRVLALAPAA